jgi:hypothetical protein
MNSLKCGLKPVNGPNFRGETVKKKYQSEALMVLHQDAVGLHELGLIDDAAMREYDEGCLVQEPDQAPKSTPGARPAPSPAYTSPRRV